MSGVGANLRAARLADRFRPGRAGLTATVTVIWGLTLGGGFLVLRAHEATPGRGGRSVSRWPAGSRLALAHDRPTLVMAAHPRCPCTRASVAALVPIVTRSAGRVEVYILVFTPEHPGRPWGPTDDLRRLGTLAGVHLIADPGGVEATRFGAETSGHVLLYAEDGGLVFHGGITPARGHEGDSAGRRAVLDLIATRRTSDLRVTPVFGCSIVFPPSGPTRRVAPWNN